MADLSTKYLGITIKNPLIAASSGFTDSIENIKNLEANGIGAVVLKSVFEEEILNQETALLNGAKKDNLIYSTLSETLDYIDLHVKEETLNKYLTLIKEAKKLTLIPIIASINCVTSSEWIDFAKKVESAGADAIELNIFLNPVDESDKNYEEIYLQIVEKVTKIISIPLSVKISKYFTKPGAVIKKLANTDIKGLVLFNRFYSPDIDINKLEITSAGKISGKEEYLDSLRWIGMMSNQVKCDLAASNGIHSSETVIKQILAGAKAVQICSVIYAKGMGYISTILNELENWMNDKKFSHIDQFRGKLSLKSSSDQAAYERMQFMKHFSGIE